MTSKRQHIKKETFVELARQIVADYPDAIDRQIAEVQQTQRVLQDGQWINVGLPDANRFAVVLREVRESREVEGYLEVLEADPCCPGMMQRVRQFVNKAPRRELLASAAYELADCPAGSVVVLKVGQETFEFRSYEADVSKRVDEAVAIDRKAEPQNDDEQLSVLEEPADVAAHVAALSNVCSGDDGYRSCAHMWDGDRKLIVGAGAAVLVRTGKISGRNTQVICQECAKTLVPLYRASENRRKTEGGT